MSSSRPRRAGHRLAGDPVLGAVVVAFTVGSALLVATATGGALSTAGAALLGAVTGFGIAFGVLVSQRRVVLDGSIVS